MNLQTAGTKGHVAKTIGDKVLDLLAKALPPACQNYLDYLKKCAGVAFGNVDIIDDEQQKRND